MSDNVANGAKGIQGSLLEQRLSSVEAKVCKLEATATEAVLWELQARVSNLEECEHKLASEAIATRQQIPSKRSVLDNGSALQQTLPSELLVETLPSQASLHVAGKHVLTTFASILFMIMGYIAILIVRHFFLLGADPSVEVDGSALTVKEPRGLEGCWVGAYTRHLCCDVGHGPRGAEICWTHAEFTFETCCIEAQCRKPLFTNFPTYEFASSRVHFAPGADGGVVWAPEIAGNRNICDGVGGDFHYAWVFPESHPNGVSAVAFCVPPTCSTNLERQWVARAIFNKCKALPCPSAKIGVSYPLVGLPYVDGMPYIMAALLVAISAVMLVTTLDIFGVKLRLAFQSFSLGLSVNALTCPLAGNMLGFDAMRVFLTMWPVIGHSHEQLSCKQFSDFWPAWAAMTSADIKWVNPGFVVLSAFLLAYSLSQRVGTPAHTCRWFFRRLARSYTRQVFQCCLALVLIVIVVPSLPLQFDTETHVAWREQISRTKAEFWDNPSLRRVLSWRFANQDRDSKNEILIVGVLENQWLLLVLLLCPMSMATIFIRRPTALTLAFVAVIVIVTKVGDLWFWKDQSFWRDEITIDVLHTPLEMLPSAVAGFTIGLCFARRSCEMSILKLCSVGVLGLAIIAFPLSGDIKVGGMPGASQYMAFQAAWTLAPVTCFSIGFGLLLVALIGSCSVGAYDGRLEPGLAARAFGMLSRLSLGMLVNHDFVRYVVQAFGLRNELLPCTAFVQVAWGVCIFVLSAAVATLQWCLLEAPLLAILNVAIG